MALEYVVKILILVAVAAVVMNIILIFSGDIQLQVREFFGPKEKSVETETIEAENFSSSQIRNYIKSCWEKTGEKYEKDAICYILKGNVSSVTQADIQTVEGVNKVNTGKFDNKKTVTIIGFRDLWDEIYVES